MQLSYSHLHLCSDFRSCYIGLTKPFWEVSIVHISTTTMGCGFTLTADSLLQQSIACFLVHKFTLTLQPLQSSDSKQRWVISHPDIHQPRGKVPKQHKLLSVSSNTVNAAHGSTGKQQKHCPWEAPFKSHNTVLHSLKARLYCRTIQPNRSQQGTLWLGLLNFHCLHEAWRDIEWKL